MYELIRELLKKDPCPECVYYHEENNTCQSKKVSTGGDGYVTLIDRVLCEPCKKTEVNQRGKKNETD